ncbi:MAG: TIM-barrel domain-containing protein [Saprospiraceae bacterium]
MSSNSLQSVISFEQRDGKYIFHTEHISLQLTSLQQGGIRSQYARKHEMFSDFSYSVIDREGMPFVSYTEHPTYIALQTEHFELRVHQDQLRLSMYTLDGDLIHDDEAKFGVRWEGNQVTQYKALQPNEIFLGLGEKGKDLNRAGNQFVHWNTDAVGYGPDTDPLYASVPFYIGIHSDLPYGIFLDNTSKSVFNFGASNTRFSFNSAEEGLLDSYFFYTGDIEGILRSYTALTGRIELPPLWSLGFQQCRYSYYPDSSLLHLAREFRQKQIPADVLYLDIHYMDAFKVFTWDQKQFQNPKELVDSLAELGFKLVLIYDPGIKIDADYLPHTTGVAQDLFLKYPDGENYTGSVWPGPCHFPDFTKPQTREWWGDWMRQNVEEGVAGFWVDMNEPAVWDQAFPDIVRFDMDGRGGSHRSGHNIYGHQMALSTKQGALKHRPNERPFVVTRAAFAGTQRHAAIWTGDNGAADEHLFLGVRLVGSLGLSGMAFSGFDIGGFAGEAHPALFARWVALGTFMPFCRAHSMINTRDAEPWSFGEAVEEISRNYLSLRYRLLPHFYSLFHEASRSGLPIVRMLPLRYWKDKNVYQKEFQNQFCLGDQLLICPVDSIQKYTKIYLPEGQWYDLLDDNLFAGSQTHLVELLIDKIPIFVKAGSILPLQGLVQYTAQAPEGPLELHLYAGSASSEWIWYEDQGDGFEYQSGDFFERKVILDSAARKVVIEKSSGNRASKYSHIRFYFHGFKQLNHPNMQVRAYSFIPPLSLFDPFDLPRDPKERILDLEYVEIENGGERIEMRF